MAHIQIIHTQTLAAMMPEASSYEDLMDERGDTKLAQDDLRQFVEERCYIS